MPQRTRLDAVRRPVNRRSAFKSPDVQNDQIRAGQSLLRGTLYPASQADLNGTGLGRKTANGHHLTCSKYPLPL